MTQPIDRPAGPQFTIREMFVTVAYAALAIIARKSLGTVSVTWSWVVFGVILFGGQAVMFASAGGTLLEELWGPRPRVLFMLCLGGLFGFLLSFN